MNGRSDAGFSGRVWDEIDRTIAAVKAANCTARRFLEVDGPYGLGLTSVAGADVRMARADGLPFPPFIQGAPSAQWDVAPAPFAPPGAPVGAAPLIFGSGTYLAGSIPRPVPTIAGQFTLGIRATTAYDAGCQPLDLAPAIAAARDVALEEERLIYYGSNTDPIALLTPWVWQIPPNPPDTNFTITNGLNLFDAIQRAVLNLEARGYAGPFALAVSASIYRQLHSPVLFVNGQPVTSASPLIDLIRNLFRGGIYMAPVIQPQGGDVRVGVVVTVGRAYSRLVVGQDWYADYRGRDGVLHDFVLMSSLQLQTSAPAALPSTQVIMQPGVVGGPPPPPPSLVVNYP